jgi:hypothetical protein
MMEPSSALGRLRAKRAWVAMFVGLAGLAAGASCRSNEINQSSSTTNNYASVGPAGATVSGPDGTQVIIPPGALTTTIDVAIVPVAAADLQAPPGAVGTYYELLPRDQLFALDVTMVLPAPAGKFWIAVMKPGEYGHSYGENGAQLDSKSGFVRFRATRSGVFGLIDPNAPSGGGGTGVPLAEAGSPGGSGGTGGDTGGTGGTGGSDGGTSGFCTTKPQPTSPGGSVTGTAKPMTVTDGYAFYDAGAAAGLYRSRLTLILSTTSGACTRTASSQGAKNSQMLRIRLDHDETTTPFVFSPGTYSDADTAGIRIRATVEETDALCEPNPVQSLSEASVTITSASGGSYKGTFTGAGAGGPVSGTFDLLTCAAGEPLSSVEPECCN